MSSSQLECRERCIFTCEKTDTSNQIPQNARVCEEFHAKIPTFYRLMQPASSHSFNEKL